MERRGVASFFAKQRARLIAVYKFAEERNLLVCGSAHKSEDYVGLYVKFGVDDAADIMPLKYLYRTQILQLAEHLNVPPEIRARTPNPDLVPGVSDKYRDILHLESGKLDLLLYGIERGMKTNLIAEALDIPQKKVLEIEELVRLTAHMRNPVMAPVLNGKCRMA